MGRTRSKKAAVAGALKEYIARRKQKHFLDLMGKIQWEPSLDYKLKRSR